MSHIDRLFSTISGKTVKLVCGERLHMIIFPITQQDVVQADSDPVRIEGGGKYSVWVCQDY